MNTNIENSIREKIDLFDPINLNEMDAVKLMRRIDSKFVFSIEKLPEILEAAKNKYLMVEIENYREQKYETVYYDTCDYDMYTSHHNGKLNRHKVRIRKYIYSDQEFLEVKKKNNRGETIKTRIGRHAEIKTIDSKKNTEFLNRYTPFDPKDLQPKLGNRFIRLTLVNKNFSERITLDYNIHFEDLEEGTKLHRNGICIAEVKRSRDDRNTDFINLLTILRINPMGFSKYCMGLAMLNQNIKGNLFKQRIRKIQKQTV